MSFNTTLSSAVVCAIGRDYARRALILSFPCLTFGNATQRDATRQLRERRESKKMLEKGFLADLPGLSAGDCAEWIPNSARNSCLHCERCVWVGGWVRARVLCGRLSVARVCVCVFILFTWLVCCGGPCSPTAYRSGKKKGIDWHVCGN